MEPEGAARGMAAIGLGAAAGAAVAPRQFLALFGIPRREVTGAAELGWRLFAARTAYIGAMALRGHGWAREAFLPVQVLDQAVFWHAYANRSVPRRAALMAAATSGAIIALDARRRRDPSRHARHGRPYSIG